MYRALSLAGAQVPQDSNFHRGRNLSGSTDGDDDGYFCRREVVVEACRAPPLVGSQDVEPHCTLRNVGEWIRPGEDVVVQARRVLPLARAQASQDTDARRRPRNLSGRIHPEELVGFLGSVYPSHSEDLDGRAHFYIAIKQSQHE